MGNLTSPFLYLYKSTHISNRFDIYAIKLTLRIKKSNKLYNIYTSFINITILDLENMKHLINFDIIDYSIFVYCKNLNTINFSYNNIKIFPIFKSCTIKYIDMSHNYIDQTHFDYTFYSCQPKILNLSYNRLHKFVCNNVTFDKLILNKNYKTVLVDANALYIKL